VPWAPRRSIAAEAQGKLEDGSDAAAATWSCWLTVVGGARMMSAMVAFWIWERLTVNVGIVLVFAAFYLRFLKRA
jgi:hypothetical protein